MADKIRLGIIGANVHLGWARRSHLPAIVASPEFELTAVCTTRCWLILISTPWQSA